MPSGDANLSRWFVEEVQPHEADLRVYLHRAFPSLMDSGDLVSETYARMFCAKTAEKIMEAWTGLFSTARNAAGDLFRCGRIISITRLVSAECWPW